MNKPLAFLLILLFVAGFVPLSSGYEGSGWIYGKMASRLDEVQYDTVYNIWNFTVSNSGWTFGTLPVNITCVTPRVVASNPLSSVVIGQTANFTGQFIIDSVNQVPIGLFLVTGIDLSSSFQSSTWTDSLKQLFLAIGSIGKMLVTLIVQVVSALTGFALPDWVAGAIVVGITAFFFIRYFKKLPWIIVAVAFFVCIAVISNIILSFQL
jgi:hypothetical protein